MAIVTVRLEIDGAVSDAHRAVTEVLDDGLFQDAINEFDGVEVLQAYIVQAVHEED